MALQPTHRDTPAAADRREQRELIRSAIHLARRLDAPVIARLHLALEVADPWACWRGLEGLGGVRAAWAAPHGETTLIAAGQASRVEGSLADASARARPLFERWIDARPEVPAALAGFAFAPGGGAERWWDGLGAGRIEIPKVLVWRRAGLGSGAAIALEVRPSSDDVIVQAELDALVAGLQVALREAPRATPVALPSSERPETGDAHDRAAWLDLVARARDAVAEGRLGKLVVARHRALAAPRGQAWHAEDTARALRAIEPHAQVFAARGARTWLVGATPELLAEVQQGQLSTVALAGTRPRGTSEAEDLRLGEALQASDKDRLEHAIVVDAITGALAPIARAVHAAEAPRLVRYRAVMHLETRIAAALAGGASVLDVARALHPTPAVSGAPREAAMVWLAAEERLDRGWYAGPIGWLDAAGGGHLAVALRGAVLEGAQAHAYVGCGIVAASDPAAEWDETEAKLAAVARALSAREDPR